MPRSRYSAPTSSMLSVSLTASSKSESSRLIHFPESCWALLYVHPGFGSSSVMSLQGDLKLTPKVTVLEMLSSQGGYSIRARFGYLYLVGPRSTDQRHLV